MRVKTLCGRGGDRSGAGRVAIYGARAGSSWVWFTRLKKLAARQTKGSCQRDHGERPGVVRATFDLRYLRVTQSTTGQLALSRQCPLGPTTIKPKLPELVPADLG
jgi:hypothetical protein